MSAPAPHPPASRWDLLWSVHPSIQGPVDRRRARAAAGLLLALAALALLDIVATLAGAYGAATDASLGVGLAAFAAIALAYGLVRIGQLNVGVVVALASIVATIASYRPAGPSQTETQLLYFMTVPILLAGILLPTRWAALAAAGIVVGSSGYEYLLDHNANEQFDASDASLVLLLGAVALLSVVAAAFAGRDARLLDRKTEELEQAHASLEAAAHERTRMFNQVAHDLATPLTPIAVQLRLLDTGKADPAKAGAILRRSFTALQRQVEDLKDLARIDSKGMRLRPTAVDLARVVSETCDSFQPAAQEKQVTLDCRSASLPVLEADGERLRQVLSNLLSNAVKFTPAGGRIDVVPEVRGDAIHVQVRDTGRGLATDETARLFKPFSQVHAPGEVAERGTGLGLYIARGIATAHRGDLTVASEGLGKGSIFTLVLPLAGATT